MTQTCRHCGRPAVDHSPVDYEEREDWPAACRGLMARFEPSDADQVLVVEKHRHRPDGVESVFYACAPLRATLAEALEDAERLRAALPAPGQTSR